MSFKILFRLFLIVLCLFVSQAQAQQGADCSIASKAIEIASKLRQLKIKQPVTCKLQDRKEVEAYLREAVKKKITQERIVHEETAYKMIGFLPKDYDYLNEMIALYTNQLGGYYDPAGKYYAMANWIPAVMQMPIAVHELTHALEDQHFNLEQIIDSANQISDVVLARTAVLEGDATAVMLDYSRQLAGQPSIAEEESVSALMVQNISGAMLSHSLRNSPSTIQALLVFPYVSGLNFTHALLRKGGMKYVDRAFTRLPESTEEILHPDKYIKGKKDFVEIGEHQSKDLEGDASVVFTDRLGEFFISTLLTTWLKPREASQAASGWGGDRLSLFDTSGSKSYILFWEVAWDNQKEADEFFKAFSRAYSARFSSTPQLVSAKKQLFSSADWGSVEISLDGTRFMLTIGR